ncbi:hypothetical protein, partial [Streptomyces sp. NPDC057677]|uniref:hypothetical protein n=1 Tax=Streptomyces sp. NPDC057677 TaxID=3346206 RepID=UPI003680B7A2
MSSQAAAYQREFGHRVTRTADRQAWHRSPLHPQESRGGGGGTLKDLPVDRPEGEGFDGDDELSGRIDGLDAHTIDTADATAQPGMQGPGTRAVDRDPRERERKPALTTLGN